MMSYDTEFRRLVARERVATLAADWGRAAPPPGPHTPQKSARRRHRNTRFPLHLGWHGRHAHRVAAHRG